MKIAKRISLVALSAIMLMVSLGLAEGMTAVDRIDQARRYMEAGQVDDALFALDFAERMDPESPLLFDARLDVLTAAERYPEVLAAVEEALATSPADVGLYIRKARTQWLMGDTDAAHAALRRGMVAAGSDEAFAAQYAEDARELIWAVADALVSSRDYEGAKRLYALRLPDEGESAMYGKLLWKLSEASAPVDLHPGITDEEFDRALAEDRLALVPTKDEMVIRYDQAAAEAERLNAALAVYGDEDSMMDMPSETPARTVERQPVHTMYGDMGLNLLSLSPNSDKVLMAVGGMAMVYDFENQQMKLIAPDAGIDQDQYDVWLHKLLTEVEERGVVWSQDGRYVAMCYPSRIFTQMQFGCNMLLIDTEAGTVRIVMEDLPIKVVPVKLTLPFIGAPVRAVFDPVEPILYIEAFFADDGTNRESVLYAYDCETGERRKIASADYLSTSSDPHMWVTARGIVRTYHHNNLDDGYGLMFSTLDGEEIRFPAPITEEYAKQQRTQQLIDLKGGRGLLLSQWSDLAIVAKGSLIPFLVDDLSEKDFERGVAIAPYTLPEERLVTYSLEEAAALDQEGGLRMRILRDELHIPYNAALSPDGRYMILAVKDVRGESFLYIHDFENGVTGKLDVSSLEENGRVPIAYTSPNNRSPRGLRWLNNNRLLVGIGSGSTYGVYELAVNP